MSNLVWSLRQIRMRLFESLLIILAIGLGVAALCSVASLLLTFNQMMESEMSSARIITIESIDRNPLGMYNIGSDESPVRLLGRMDDERVSLTIEDLRLIESEVPAVAHAIAIKQHFPHLADAGVTPSVDVRTPEGQAKIREWNEANSVPTFFTFPAALEAEGLAIKSGSNMTQSDLDQQQLVGVIGANLADRLFGESDPVGQQIDLVFGSRPASVTVIGVLSEIKPAMVYTGDYSLLFSTRFSELNDSLFMPFTAYDPLLRSSVFSHLTGSSIDRVYVLPRDDVDFSAAVSSLRSYVESRYGLAMSVRSPFENLHSSREMMNNLMVALGAFGSVALVIAAINSLNLMIARVLRRTKTFGISAALGLSRKQIFMQFLAECFILSLLGTLVGMAICIAFTRIFTALVGQGLITIGVPVQVWFLGLVVAVVTTLAFGLYPSLEASRIDVVDALRTE
ncbi:MAG: ABC transporter permease [Bacillota bacterium]